MCKLIELTQKIPIFVWCRCSQVSTVVSALRYSSIIRASYLIKDAKSISKRMGRAIYFELLPHSQCQYLLTPALRCQQQAVPLLQHWKNWMLTCLARYALQRSFQKVRSHCPRRYGDQMAIFLHFWNCLMTSPGLRLARKSFKKRGTPESEWMADWPAWIMSHSFVCFLAIIKP